MILIRRDGVVSDPAPERPALLRQVLLILLCDLCAIVCYIGVKARQE